MSIRIKELSVDTTMGCMRALVAFQSRQAGLAPSAGSFEMRNFLCACFLLLGSPALAWDPVGDVTSGKVFSNVAREGGKIIDQGRTDLSNGLNRIDPRITQIGRDIDRMRLELQSSIFTGPALEQWFWASRNSAMNGAMPMPSSMRQALQGWYDSGLMDIVRFKVGDGGALNLANNSIRIGTATAVTLIDVIVFKGPSEASDPALWAHEMKHVEQFRSWGVHSFAVQYMRSWDGVENPAYAIQAEYSRQHQNLPTVYNQQLPQQYQSPSRCVTQVGICPLAVQVPPGQLCNCPTYYGPVFGNTQ